MSVCVSSILCLYVLRSGWWPQRSLASVTRSDLGSCFSVLLICGGVSFSIVLCVGCASALRVSSVWMCFVEFAGSAIGGRDSSMSV